MTEVRKTPRQLEVLVLRVDRPDEGYRWELRRYGAGMPFRQGDERYQSQADARLAGENALTLLRVEEQATEASL